MIANMADVPPATTRKMTRIVSVLVPLDWLEMVGEGVVVVA